MKEAYHTKFLPSIINEAHPICHLEALNAVADLHTWAPKHCNQLVHVYTDSAMAAAIFQEDKGRDEFIHTCVQQL